MDESKEEPAVTAVVAFRLATLERDLGALNTKLDRFIDAYPSKELLELILSPYKEDIEDLKAKQIADEKQKVEQRQQLKYITYAAMISPIMSIIVAALVTLMTIGMK